MTESISSGTEGSTLYELEVFLKEMQDFIYVFNVHYFVITSRKHISHHEGEGEGGVRKHISKTDI